MRSRVMRGIGWKVVSQVVQQGSRVAVAIVLARLLTPHDYGIAGMVLVFSSLIIVFSDLSLGSALVQRRHLSEADRSTVFWTAAAAGLAFTLVGIAVAGPLASFYGQPEVKGLFIALSLGFFVQALATTQIALLTREMNFRNLELRQMAAALAGGAVGIAAALKGMGAWAIILQQLTVTCVSTVLLWQFTGWRPRFTYSLQSLRGLGGFSANVFGTRVLFYVNRNADNLLIGKFLGPSALGAYAVSYNVMLVPFDRIAGPIQEVLYPAFSKMQDDFERIGAAWLRVNRLVGAISIPALAGLVVVAPDFIPTVLGDKWEPAVPVIQILAWVGLLQSLQRLNSSILMARDRTGTLLGYAVVVVVTTLGAFVIGLHWGIVGVSAAFAITSTVVEPYYTWLTGRAIGLSLKTFLRNLSGIAQATAGMVVVVLAVRLVAEHAGVGQVERLLAAIAAGCVTYPLLCVWRAPEVIGEIRALRSRGKRLERPATPARKKAASRRALRVNGRRERRPQGEPHLKRRTLEPVAGAPSLNGEKELGDRALGNGSEDGAARESGAAPQRDGD
jgi:O-antigen/teichoic acid export membrane protein